jgi:UDP-N-acetylglucosamine 2-epimerase
MPEEVNRIVADHVSQLLLAPTTHAVEQLRSEGLGPLAFCVGDVMVDVLLKSLPLAWRPAPFDCAQAGEYALVTVHRAGNTDDPRRLRAICDAISALPMPIIFPVHPRTAAAIGHQSLSLGPNVHVVPPAPYLTMLALERDARVILTDSGGVQKEAFLLRRPCVTLRAETEWTETLAGAWNVLVDVDKDAIVAAACRPAPEPLDTHPFGAGDAAERIIDCLETVPRRRC